MMLIVAESVSAIMGKLESTVVIVLVLILNALLGTVKQVKAEKANKSSLIQKKLSLAIF